MQKRNPAPLAEGAPAPLLAALAAAQPGPALVADPATDLIRAANAPAAALFGRDALEGGRLSRLFPDAAPALIVFAEEIADRGAAWTRALPGRRADGAALDLEIDGRALASPDGLLLFFVLHDLGERARRNAEIDADRYARGGLLEWRRLARLSGEAARVSELILTAAGDGIYGVDVEGRTTFANPAAERMLGWGAEELLGRSIHDLIHHTHADGRRYANETCPIYNAFRFAKVNTVEDEVFWRKDGRPIRVEYTSTPIIDQGQVQGAVVVFRDITERKANEARLREALEEVAALKQRLEMENEYLQEEVRARSPHSGIIGRSAAILRTLEQIALVAPTDANVLITGESGSGKELVAQAVHRESRRADRPLIRVNCAAIPRELFESEFFGHVKGAFTGAVRDRAGRFELAHGGTLFLDEIGEIPLELQGKLLRVLQERSFERVGEARTREIDVRLIAATNRDLAAEARAGRFREDLYFRLNVFPIHCAPLRERREDVPLLAEHFLDRACARLGAPRPTLTKAAVAQLSAYDWPGNARELQNVIERAVIVSRGGKATIDLGAPAPAVAETPATAAAPPGVVTEAERRARDAAAVEAALAAAGGRVSGPGGAAALLGVKPSTLYSRLRRRRG
ncbi:MAG: PAS domain-containing protein [Rhodobacteraceae bacterium]|nr:MAG: PAS domain-containing protein [Paracoccaceae bacterium]